MKIIPYTSSYRDRLISLWQQCQLTRPWNDPGADIDRAISHSASTIFLATDSDQVIGSVMCGYDGHRGWVYYLASTPERRGLGTGRILMRAAEDWLRDMGCPKIELMVRGTNTAALGFYNALGYQSQDVQVQAKWLIEPDP